VRGLADGLRFAHGQGQRLLAVHVLAVLHGLDGVDRVPVGGAGDEHRVDVRTLADFAEITVDLQALVVLADLLGIVVVDALGALVQANGLHIADRGDLHVRAVQEIADMAPHHLAHADQRHAQALAGRHAVRAARNGWDDGGNRQRGGTIAEDIATGKCRSLRIHFVLLRQGVHNSSARIRQSEAWDWRGNGAQISPEYRGS
jgi:hypothetical protein